jgi:acetyl-CoA carboxylase carboxyltransferase component
VRGGAADARVGDKAGYAEKLAREMRLPIIRLVDGTGGGGSVKTLEMTGRTYVPANPSWGVVVALMNEVPVVGACMGSVAGLGAVRVVTSHFSLMVRGTSQLFVAGPPVVERGVGQKVTKEELGGSHIHARGSGAVDNEVASEGEAFAAVRRFLSYLPSSAWQEGFGIEEIIDPRDTRPLLCDWVATAYERLPTELGPKLRGMRP